MTSHPVDVLVDSPLEVVTAGVMHMLCDVGDRVSARVRAAAPGGGRPDVVIFDSLWLHRSGETGLRALIGAGTVPVLVLVHELRPDLGARALALGAHAGLPLGTTTADLVATIEAASGRPGAAAGPTPRPPVRLGADVGLTPRESEVLGLIAQGFGNQEIADRTFLSINSVKTFVRSAYRRIGARNRSQAVVWAIQHGFPTRPAVHDEP